jgi:hypothetical protein
MAVIVREMPPSGTFEAEHRGFFQPETEAHVGVIIQGSVDTTGLLKGNEWDQVVETYQVRLLVGPLWQHVHNVVPKVTVDRFQSSNPDQDDFMTWGVQNLGWDTVGELGPNNDELRIRLMFDVKIQGENAEIARLGYFLMASGRRLGEGGINEPGPVKKQG